MPRIEPVDHENATGKARRLLDHVQSSWGMKPNMLKTLAHSPAALKGFLGLRNALYGGVLPDELREQIALTVAEAAHSDYCLAAHSAIGKAVGLSDEEIADGRRGTSPDRKVEAALRFASQLVEGRGWVSDEDFAQVKDAGYDEGEIVEIFACVAMYIFATHFNHVAGTEVDFPAASELART